MAERNVPLPRRRDDGSALEARDAPFPSRLRFWVLFLIAALLIVARYWLPEWYVKYFPGTTEPIAFSSEQETQITDYLIVQCSGGQCGGGTPHVRLRQIAGGLVSYVSDRMFFGSHGDIINQIKPVYDELYVQYSLYRFFDRPLASCATQLKTARSDARVADFEKTFRELAQDAPDCAFLSTSFLKLSDDEKRRSGVITEYLTAFDRLNEELAFQLTDWSLHDAFDALDGLSRMVSENMSEKLGGEVQRQIFIAGQYFSIRLKLNQAIETMMYKEQREEKKKNVELFVSFILGFLLFVFLPLFRKSGSAQLEPLGDKFIHQVSHYSHVFGGMLGPHE